MAIKYMISTKLLFALSIMLLAVSFFGFQSSCLAQNDSCIKIYTFENDSTSPISTCRDGWTLGGTPHSGNSSLVSTGQGISKFCVKVQGPANIEFWWYSNKANNNKFLFQIDKKPHMRSYDNITWEKVKETIDEDGEHTLNWLFSKGPTDKTNGWIDDLCIRRIPCDKECPGLGAEMKVIETQPYASPTNVSPSKPLNKTLVPSEEIPPKVNGTAAMVPEKEAIPIGTTSGNIKEFYVIPGEGEGTSFMFPTITKAINSVPSGATIKVVGGTYKEDLFIDKPVKLIGIGKSPRIIMATERGISIKSRDVTIIGFTIEGGHEGINLTSAENCEIIDNRLEKNDKFGVVVTDCPDSNINISKNYLLGNKREGIRLDLSSKVNVSSNTIENVGTFGIALTQSDGNTISDNMINGSKNEGIYLEQSNSNVIEDNKFLKIAYCNIFSKNSNNTLNMSCNDDNSCDEVSECRCCK